MTTEVMRTNPCTRCCFTIPSCLHRHSLHHQYIQPPRTSQRPWRERLRRLQSRTHRYVESPPLFSSFSRLAMFLFHSLFYLSRRPTLASAGAKTYSIFIALTIVALTRTLVDEGRRQGIRANVILPGYIDTDMTRSRFHPARLTTTSLARSPFSPSRTKRAR